MPLRFSVRKKSLFSIISAVFLHIGLPVFSFLLLRGTSIYADFQEGSHSAVNGSYREEFKENRKKEKTPNPEPSISKNASEKHLILQDSSAAIPEEEKENRKFLKNDEPVKPRQSSTNAAVRFYLEPPAAQTDNPLVKVHGKKEAGSSIFLNSEKLISESQETSWELSFLLSPGKNKLFFESKNTQGSPVGTSEVEIHYRPQNNTASPIIDIIKEKAPTEIKTEIEKTIERKPEEKPTAGEDTQIETPKLSNSAQTEIRKIVEDHDFNYISGSSSQPLTKFLTHEDQKEIITQTFGGPRIISSTHPSQNSWSSQNDVKISWESIENALYYVIGISDTPIDPEDTVANDVTEWQLEDLPDGIWYFSVKAKVPNGTTATNFYKIMIDTTPPEIKELSILDPYPSYKNGGLISLKLKFSDNLIKPEDLETIPAGLPLGFIAEESLKNVRSRQSLLPDYSRLIDADFTSIDTNFSKERVMVDSIKSNEDGLIEAIVSYRISIDNKKGDGEDLSILVAVQDYGNNKVFSHKAVSLVNKASPIEVSNPEEIADPVPVDSLIKEGLVLTGKSSPNSTIILEIYSDNPITVTVISDDEGNWSYTLKEPLPPGNHTVYAYIKSNLLQESSPIQVASFSLVNEAQAQELGELAKPIFSFKPVSLENVSYNVFPPSLPPSIKLALLLYGLSFLSLILALIVWYRENPPRDV